MEELQTKTFFTWRLSKELIANDKWEWQKKDEWVTSGVGDKNDTKKSEHHYNAFFGTTKNQNIRLFSNAVTLLILVHYQ